MNGETGWTAMDDPSRSRFARWLSRIFHPFVIILPCTVWIGYLSGLTVLESLKWMGAILLILVLPMSLLVLVNIRAGRYTNENVPVRQRRYVPYMLGLALWIMLLIVLTRAGAPRIVLACLYAALLAQVVATVVNLFTKVSVHAIASGGCTAVLFALSPIAGAVLAAISIAVGWARVQLGDHTVGQVVLGWAIAVLCVAIVFTAYL